jgi:AcrR family transcriptional regulator
MTRMVRGLRLTFVGLSSKRYSMLCVSGEAPASVQVSKQQRTRETIRAAAMELFAAHGYDAVTVADIAARARVGRSTFFRYFADKQEVLFEDDAAAHALLARAIAGAARQWAPLGDSLVRALRALHSALLVLADAKATRTAHNPLQARLIASHPALRGCSLVRERAYTDVAMNALIEQGADPATARLAAHVAAACYDIALVDTFTTPQRLPAAVDRAFHRLGEAQGFLATPTESAMGQD